MDPICSKKEDLGETITCPHGEGSWCHLIEYTDEQMEEATGSH